MGSNGWKATASPARPTERSDSGTTAGVLAAVNSYLDNRHPSFATDAEGKLTANAQLTGRMLVLSKVEILALAGYLERGLGFGGSNAIFLTDLDFITRGGKVPFILGLDANEPPESWNQIAWGETTFLEHIQAEIVTVTNSNFTCVAGNAANGGSTITLSCLDLWLPL